MKNFLLLLITLFCAESAFGLPAKGVSAPTLASVQLIQPPATSQITWDSLRGKVVVLEFWATWCAPCIAGLPHFNQVVRHLDPARFQFISIDDEDPKVVRAFLARKEIAGWVGIDASGKVFDRYGVKQRPTAIIVDRQGKVVATTEMDSIHESDLEAVAQGKDVVFKAAMEVETERAPATAQSVASSLFAVSFSEATPDTRLAMLKHPPTGTDYRGIDAASLLTYIYDPISARVVLKTSLPKGLYNLQVKLPGVTNEEAAAITQTAVFCGLHIQVRPRTIRKRQYLLRSTSFGAKLLSPSVLDRKTLRGYWGGKLVISNGSMDDLASALETALETPVVNQTGISGRFDARLQLKQEDLAGANTMLKTTLGLELVLGTQEKTTEFNELVEQPAGSDCAIKLK
ncbi:hypothetical protein BH10ACI4_BH10ACI4_38120 [soil metagenome]